MSALTASARPALSAHARALAAQLSVLFERDSGIVARLNDAQRRLAGANERLWSGLAPDALGLLYDGAAPAGGHSQIAELIKAVGPEPGPGPPVAVLGALSEIHWTIHRAFCEYQIVCEERRQLAVDVGELAQQLTDTLCATGWSRQDARSADVHQLASSPVAGERRAGERAISAPAKTGAPWLADHAGAMTERNPR
jgi:hypothetical protein